MKKRRNPPRIVRIKKEYRNASETAEDLFYVLEDNGDRLIITPVNWNKNTLRPQELVRRYEVEFRK